MDAKASAVYSVCASGCGILPPLMVDEQGRCLGCGGRVEHLAGDSVAERLLDRASPLFSEAERRALEIIARGRVVGSGGLRSAVQDPALASARQKLDAALELRDFLLRPATEKFGEMPRD